MKTYKRARADRIFGDIITLGLYEVWYRKTNYSITSESIEVNSGVLRRQEVVIPADKLVAVQAKLSPFVGMSEVVIDTGAGKTTTAKGLTRASARSFASDCLTLKQQASATS